MVGISTKLHADPTTETASGAGQRKAETLVDVIVPQRVEEFLKIAGLRGYSMETARKAFRLYLEQ